MALLNVKDLKARPAAPPKKVEVPEWDCHVFVKSLSGTVASNIVTSKEKLPPIDAMVAFIVAGVVDEDGTPLFGKDDSKWLRSKEFSVLQNLAVAVMDVSGLSDGAVDDAEGN